MHTIVTLSHIVLLIVIMTQSEMRLLRLILLMPLIRVIALLCSGSTADVAQRNRVSHCLTSSEASRPLLRFSQFVSHNLERKGKVASLMCGSTILDYRERDSGVQVQVQHFIPISCLQLNSDLFPFISF